jgi:TolB-like protein/Tfp pilus assembly protein PilF
MAEEPPQTPPPTESGSGSAPAAPGDPPTRPGAAPEASVSPSHSSHGSHSGSSHHPQLPTITFIEELKRRNIGRVALLYIGVAYVSLEIFELFFHLLEMPPWTGRAGVLLAVIGFPITLLIAWAYEITPEGLKPTDEVPIRKSIAVQTGRRLDRAIIVVLAVALSYFVVDKFWLSKHAGHAAESESAAEHTEATPEGTASHPTATASATPVAVIPEKSVAVLPFVDMSEKHDQEYFSDGLSEELIDRLVKVPDLRVPARTSSFYFKGKQATIAEIAKALGVAHVLEGSIRKSGNSLRITAQLIRVDNGYHVWSQTYDRRLDDIFKVQDEISAQVVKSLKSALFHYSIPKGVGTRNIEAYDLYLQASALYQQSANFNPGVAKALESALKLDPSFSEAWALLSSEFVNEAMSSFYDKAPRDKVRAASDRARRAAQHALDVSPDSADAHAAMTKLLAFIDWDFAAADFQVQRALTLEPENQGALAWKGLLEGIMGHPQLAHDFVLKSLNKDPLNAVTYNNLWRSLTNLGRFQEAVDALRKQASLGGSWRGYHANLSISLLLAGDQSAAKAEVEAEEDHDTKTLANSMISFAAGDHTKADTWLKEMEQKGSQYAYDLATIRAFRGEHDLAFKWLEQAYRQRDYNCIFVKSDPLLKGLHGDPRWNTFLQKMKLPVD